MDWESYGQTSVAFGKHVTGIVGLIFIYVLTFKWITRPIFLALFTETLDGHGSEGEIIVAILLWIVVFTFHVGIFAYGTGAVIKSRERIKEAVKNLIGRI